MGVASEYEREGVIAPVSVRSLVGRFALAGLIALVLVSALTAYASVRVGTEQAIEDARRVTRVSVLGIVEPVLTDDLLAGDPATLERLDRAVREGVLQGSLVRVKLWRPDGTIVYSDEPRLIGQRFDLEADELAVLDGGETDAEVSDLSEAENRYETESKLLEVYERTQTPDGTPLLFEAYFRYSGVTSVGRELWGQFAPIAIGALILLELVQIPLAWSMARRLKANQRAQEQLLHHAIDASDAERRRIAGDLHDGVVQDLTGVSLGLAAIGRAPAVDRQQVLDASASIRASIKSLRSLLVEIYPPNLQQEGLESALGDLLQHLALRGVSTRLDTDLDGAEVPPAASALLYRTAQEALRNVNSHAQADHVLVALRAVDGSVEISIDDDGRGFPAERIAEREEEGHLGLRSLAGLVADLGGTLTVRSSPGAGTRVVASVPIGARLPS